MPKNYNNGNLTTFARRISVFVSVHYMMTSNITKTLAWPSGLLCSGNQASKSPPATYSALARSSVFVPDGLRRAATICV
jgi:hypothetical protein